ncbi:aspartyl/asparaginyl beta-hydroxylase domain-containing protein [Dokdonella sp.]|uniref:aspartyl/asparaginyl beta-hydroxylase domain-containing protein n=1 Tax=Dokdonella sp. TaxID=2291710 RepID=UPI003C3AD9BA
MLALPDQPVLDKIRLIGGCSRLDLNIEAPRLQDEVARLPESFWGQSGGRVGVHNPAQAIFLRGHAPAQGNLPIDEREALAHLPAVRELIERIVPAQPMRCLIAMLPPGAVIAPHIDQADYFSKTIRLHVPIVTSDAVWMYCNGQSYRMRTGEIWALNNSSTHGVINDDDKCERIHLICDFLASAELEALLLSGQRDLGERNFAIESRLFAARGKARLA